MFDDNGMVLKDVDVLSIAVDVEIRNMLERNQRQIISNMLSMQMAEANFDREQKETSMQIELDNLKHQAALNTLQIKKIQDEGNRSLIAAESRFAEAESKTRLLAQQEQDEITGQISAKQLERAKAKEEQRLAFRDREIEQESKEKEAYASTVAKVMESISPDLIAAMQGSTTADTLKEVSKAMAPLAIARGESVADTVNTLMRGTSLEDVIGKVLGHAGE